MKASDIASFKVKEHNIGYIVVYSFELVSSNYCELTKTAHNGVILDFTNNHLISITHLSNHAISFKFINYDRPNHYKKFK